MTIRGPIKIERIIALILIISFIVYALFEAYKLILGPRIEITSPENWSTVDSNIVIIEGKARNVSYIALNDRQIYIDENGIFRQKLLLPPGYTIMKVTAEDRFKSKVEKKISLWRPFDNTEQSVIDELKGISTTTPAFATSTASTTNNTEL